MVFDEETWDEQDEFDADAMGGDDDDDVGGDDDGDNGDDDSGDDESEEDEDESNEDEDEEVEDEEPEEEDEESEDDSDEEEEESDEDDEEEEEVEDEEDEEADDDDEAEVEDEDEEEEEDEADDEDDLEDDSEEEEGEESDEDDDEEEADDEDAEDDAEDVIDYEDDPVVAQLKAEEETEELEYDPDAEIEVLSEGDPDVFLSADAFPDAEPQDFRDDNGQWRNADYERAAQHVFGSSEYFGETSIQQYEALGYRVSRRSDDLRERLDRALPGSGNRVVFVEKEGVTVARGVVRLNQLRAASSQGVSLSDLLAGVVLGMLNVIVERIADPSPAKPQPLPSAVQTVDEKDSVDLRKYCTPVGDQGQTSRCAAFAWTHAVELGHRILGHNVPELSATYTMMQFQKMMGDFKNYLYAYKGGEGTVSGSKPGRTILQHGSCQEELWGDKDKKPRAADAALDKDALTHKLDAKVHSIKIDDVKKVLSAGNPVQFGMNVGNSFSDVGRDGVFKAADKPGKDTGGHAMLIVGYIGNYYIVKNSWGPGWADKGYCYIPKKVLLASDPDFTALLINRPA